MVTTTYTICGHKFVAVKVASCSKGKYVNYTHPKRETTKVQNNDKVYA